MKKIKAKSNTEFNTNLSFVRFILCIAVLLYHLQILKGGYLAVCSFFVLAGYFGSKSLDRNPSILRYYGKRLLKVYLPLLVVVLATIAGITVLKIDIFNMKPEINSILFGYNNYWQLSTNADYFAKHINSPFIHLWYIAILLQIELVFPWVFVGLKKLGKKLSKFIPVFIFFILAVASTLYFYYIARHDSLMNTYYDTFSRCFSFILGAFVYSIHGNYDKELTLFKKSFVSVICFVIYTILLCAMFVLISSSSKYFAVAMILSSIVTCRLIDYGVTLYKNNRVLKNKIVDFISDISYEIYLVQYPVIFFFTNVKINNFVKVPIIILVTIFVSTLIHIALKKTKINKLLVFKVLLQLCLLVIVGYGAYNYIIMKDYTKEMNSLKESLNNNEKLMEQKQKEYLEKSKQDEKQLEEYMKSLEIDEDKLREYAGNLKVVGVGDSILLDAIDQLYKVFPNGYFDGKISRSTCAAVSVLSDIKKKGIKWDVLVFNLGTNDYPSDTCKDQIMEVAGDDSTVFWLNTTHPDYPNCNEKLYDYAKRHKNIHIFDWESEVKKHPDYLYVDYTHLRPHAYKLYAEFIKEEIFKYYLDLHKKERDKSINDYKDKHESKITFYGNELLINVYDKLDEQFENVKFEAKKDMKFSDLESALNNDKKLSKKLVFMFDSQSNIKLDDYIKLANTYKDNEIYIISLKDIKIDNKNVTVVKLDLNEEDYLNDGIHLSKSGSDKLLDTIKKTLK